MDFFSLPTDILEHIYHIKHKSDFKDVLYEIENIQQSKYEDCISLLYWFRRNLYATYGRYGYFKIITALRNEGYLTTCDLIKAINGFYESDDVIYYFLNESEGEEIEINVEKDIQIFENKTDITMNFILKLYEDELYYSRKYYQIASNIHDIRQNIVHKIYNE